MSTTLERQARRAWVDWASGARGGGYAQHQRCDKCGEITYCRGRRKDHMICLPCFDAGAVPRKR